MHYMFLRFPDNKPKAATLSYDDGCRADIKLSQLLTKHGIKCTFNVNSAYLAKDETDWYLTKDEIQKYILDAGHELATHGQYHKGNGHIRPIEGIRDVLN